MKFKKLNRHRWHIKEKQFNPRKLYTAGIDEAVSRCLNCEFIKYCMAIPITPEWHNICIKGKGENNGN